MTVLSDTSGKEVMKALAAARSSRGGGTSGLALTLVVIAEDAAVEQATEAACVAASAHPCRLIVVTRQATTSREHRLDAEICVAGRLGPGEAVILRMRGRLALHAESVTLPLLAADVPVVAWWQGVPPERIARDPLGVFADRRVTDCAAHAQSMTALTQRASDYVPGDTDLAWTRITPWRSLLVDAFDTIEPRSASMIVRGTADKPSMALLAGWLRVRLGVAVQVLGDTDSEKPDNTGGGNREITGVEVTLDDGSTLQLRMTSDGSVAVDRDGMPERRLPLRYPTTGEALAEELRHLDPDQLYAAALQAATDVEIPSAGGSTTAHRIHEWHDPAMSLVPLDKQPLGTQSA